MPTGAHKANGVRNGSAKFCIKENFDTGRDEETKFRLRRTQSVAKAELITEGERRVRRVQVDKPCHEVCDSLFSWSSGFNRYEGFINWGALILIIGGTRLFLENFIKYGILISPVRWINWFQDQRNQETYHTPIFLLVSNLHFVFVFILEKLMAKNLISSRNGIPIHIVHLISLIIIPVIVCQFYTNSFSLIGRMVICSLNTVWFLKLWSYIQVNYWCRCDRDRQNKYSRRRSFSFITMSSRSSRDSSEEDTADCNSNSNYVPIEYPENLTVGSLAYFLCAPTLCYELNFPKSHRIRKRFLLRRFLEVLILSQILMGLFQQWIIPSVKNSFRPFSEMNYIKCLERILKLAIPNHLLWLIWFYLFFHSMLNTIGELLCFGDRNFYQDWWNAKDVGTFWRLWNLPVHKWCVRHLFLPVVKSRKSRITASLLVFLLSAFFHEYLVSVPLGMYKVGVFMGMLVQVPLVYISQIVAKNIGDRYGNVIVWTSLILGQPIGIMVYYHDYIVQNFEPSMLEL